MTELAKARGKCVAIELVYVVTELASVGKISIATKYFYVMTELAKERRNYFAIETICIATELAAIENFATHDRAGMQGLGEQR